MSFQSYTVAVGQRALYIAKETMASQTGASSETVEPVHKDFALCALDLLGALAQGLRENFSGLLAAIPSDTGGQPGQGSTGLFLELLIRCLADPSPDLRQSAFGMVGDCFKSCPSVLTPVLVDVFREAVVNLDVQETSVCNNVIWSIGEAVGGYGREVVTTFLQPTLLSAIIELCITDDDIPLSLRQNVVIALGRIGAACPESLSSMEAECLVCWLNGLKFVQSSDERFFAFSGLVAVLRLNPRLLLRADTALAFLSCCAGAWEGFDSTSAGERDVGLASALRQIMLSLRDANVDSWTGLHNRLADGERRQLVESFHL